MGCGAADRSGATSAAVPRRAGCAAAELTTGGVTPPTTSTKASNRTPTSDPIRRRATAHTPVRPGHPTPGDLPQTRRTSLTPHYRARPQPLAWPPSHPTTPTSATTALLHSVCGLGMRALVPRLTCAFGYLQRLIADL
ncbi:hypothetical protein Aglo01_29920 [Actinokineospora globicatena]|nr:hypothetical protein Aglo01_29920 [Actinokineospora globicatena]GLW84826.1 hypothetical protein Aglo02_24660 [Actinokineospora globicatena]